MAYGNITLSKYMEGYRTMFKVNGDNFYIDTSLNRLINYYSGTGKHYVLHGHYNSFLELLICAAYGTYTVQNFGYSEAKGLIVKPKNNNIITREEVFLDVFKKDWLTKYMTPGGEHSLIVYDTYDELNNSTLTTYNGSFYTYRDENRIEHTVYTRNRYVELETWASILGFSLSFEIDSTNNILFVSPARV